MTDPFDALAVGRRARRPRPGVRGRPARSGGARPAVGGTDDQHAHHTAHHATDAHPHPVPRGRRRPREHRVLRRRVRGRPPRRSLRDARRADRPRRGRDRRHRPHARRRVPGDRPAGAGGPRRAEPVAAAGDARPGRGRRRGGRGGRRAGAAGHRRAVRAGRRGRRPGRAPVDGLARGADGARGRRGVRVAVGARRGPHPTVLRRRAGRARRAGHRGRAARRP